MVHRGCQFQRVTNLTNRLLIVGYSCDTVVVLLSNCVLQFGLCNCNGLAQVWVVSIVLTLAVRGFQSLVAPGGPSGECVRVMTSRDKDIMRLTRWGMGTRISCKMLQLINFHAFFIRETVNTGCFRIKPNPSRKLYQVLGAGHVLWHVHTIRCFTWHVCVTNPVSKGCNTSSPWQCPTCTAGGRESIVLLPTKTAMDTP